MRKNNSFIGLLLVMVGAIILILRLLGIRIIELSTADFWVFIILLVGLSFEFAFFLTGSKPGLLIPGGIITTIGFLFLFETMTNWHFAAYTWPVYIISVSIGLLQMYFFSKREKGLLISGSIVGGVGVFFMACTTLSKITSIISLSVLIPIAFIAGGIALLFSGTSKKYQY